MKTKSIYIHIPFCIRKCNYCAFISYTNITDYEKLYIQALTNEINTIATNNTIETIYLGGGTPNLLNLRSLEQIFDTLKNNFNISQNSEITMEFNPKISDLSYIKEVKNLGVNRISLGVQSFNDRILKTLNRIHNTDDIINTIENIKKAGINNYSVDLIYGIFGQKLSDIKADLNMVRSLKPTHVSTYGLKIEENTPFAKMDKTNLPDENLCADMYLTICEKLDEMNFNHYEISNFAKAGFEAKHNLTYWRNQEYYGFGAAAHGYINQTRYKNTDGLEEYIQNPNKKEILNNNSEKDILEEKIFLGLRLKEGINLNEIKEQFNLDLLNKKADFIKQLTENNFATIENDTLSLTNKGFLISNYILGELLV